MSTEHKQIPVTSQEDDEWERITSGKATYEEIEREKTARAQVEPQRPLLERAERNDTLAPERTFDNSYTSEAAIARHFPAIDAALALAIPAEYADRIESLIKIARVDATQEGLIRRNFGHYFRDLAELRKEVFSLVVTDETEIQKMALAREKRLRLKSIRVNAEHTRKAGKDESLRYGRLWDGLYKLIEGPCVEGEDHLEKQENFAKIAEQNRRQELKERRSLELSPYVETTVFFDLAHMSEEAYQMLLSGSIAGHEKKQRDLHEAEQLRIAQERQEIAEREQKSRKAGRVQAISSIGFNWDGEKYAYEDLIFTEFNLTNDANGAFNERLDNLSKIIADRKLAKAKAEEEAREEQVRLQRIADEKLLNEQRAAKAAEEARLAPDREKVSAWLRALAAMSFGPEVEDETLSILVASIERSIHNLILAAEKEIGGEPA
jgi:hypothetical protein